MRIELMKKEKIVLSIVSTVSLIKGVLGGISDECTGKAASSKNENPSRMESALPDYKKSPEEERRDYILRQLASFNGMNSLVENPGSLLSKESMDILVRRRLETGSISEEREGKASLGIRIVEIDNSLEKENDSEKKEEKDSEKKEDDNEEKDEKLSVNKEIAYNRLKVLAAMNIGICEEELGLTGEFVQSACIKGLSLLSFGQSVINEMCRSLLEKEILNRGKENGTVSFIDSLVEYGISIRGLEDVGLDREFIEKIGETDKMSSYTEQIELINPEKVSAFYESLLAGERGIGRVFDRGSSIYGYILDLAYEIIYVKREIFDKSSREVDYDDLRRSFNLLKNISRRIEMVGRICIVTENPNDSTIHLIHKMKEGELSRICTHRYTKLDLCDDKIETDCRSILVR